MPTRLEKVNRVLVEALLNAAREPNLGSSADKLRENARSLVALGNYEAASAVFRLAHNRYGSAIEAVCATPQLAVTPSIMGLVSNAVDMERLHNSFLYIHRLGLEASAGSPTAAAGIKLINELAGKKEDVTGVARAYAVFPSSLGSIIASDEAGRQV